MRLNPSSHRPARADARGSKALSTGLLRTYGAFAVFIGAVGGVIAIVQYFGLGPVTLGTADQQAAVTAGRGDGKPCLSITTPEIGDRVRTTEIVHGTAARKNARIAVLVRPLETNAIWVQGWAYADSNGDWTAVAQFGERLKEHVGQDFAIRAVADPRNSLEKGQILADWPEARCQSSIVRVRRE